MAVYDGSGDIMYWNILGAGEIIGRSLEDTAKGASSTDRQYYVKDHLGSVRSTVKESGSAAHQSDYYPFGLEMPGRVWTLEPPRERYTGHEIEELGSNTTWYYAGARMYDPVVGRWMTTDPLAEKFPGWSPYNYVGGNPISLFDPSGMAAQDYYLNLISGTVEWREGSDDRTDEGLVHLAGDDASVTDITDELDERGFEWSMSAEGGGLAVDTREALKGWTMMQIFSPENAMTILGLAVPIHTGGTTGRVASRGAYSVKAARGANGVVDALNGLRAGRSHGVKVVGSADELKGLFDRLSSGGKAVEGSTYQGRLVRLPDGTTVGLRTGSRSGGPTIDIKLPDGTLQKVHVR